MGQGQPVDKDQLATPPAASTFTTRTGQMFPILGDLEMARIARFGVPVRYEKG